jgi:crotonobetainyl-CoA hydratase
MSETSITNDAPIVLVQRRGRVMVVTINRPEARNAVNREVWQRIGRALEEAEHDVSVWAVVITGAGDKSFCAGADLKAISRGEKIVPDEPVEAGWGFAGFVRHPISKPTIAAVNGTALGGGTEICLASDLVVAADIAQFGLPEVKRGIFAGAGGVFRLPRQLPRKVAMEMIMTGEPIDATRALELGLINRVVSADQVVDAAVALAEKICEAAPLSVQASKRVALGIVDGFIAGEESDWDLSAAEGGALMKSADAKEGPLAFAEKRAPNWQGQ